MLATRPVAATAAAVIATVAATVMAAAHGHSVSTRSATSISAGGASIVSASVVEVGPGPKAVTLSFGQRDVRYVMCPGAVRPAVQLGEFTRASISGGCLSGMSVAPLPVCAPSVEVGSYVNGLWLGANPSAHSVLFQTSGVSRVIEAARWCTVPTARAADGAAVSLAQIPKGATVRVVTSGGGWVTGVLVQRPARAG